MDAYKLYGRQLQDFVYSGIIGQGQTPFAKRFNRKGIHLYGQFVILRNLNQYQDFLKKKESQ